MTIIFVVCFSRPMIFNSLSSFDSLAFDTLNPPSQVNLLDHQILSNYWIDEISFRATCQCLIIALHNSGVCLISFFSKQNMTCRPQGRELPSEPSNPPAVPKFGLSIVGWAKITIQFLGRWTFEYGNHSLTWGGYSKPWESLGAARTVAYASSPGSKAYSPSVGSEFLFTLHSLVAFLL